MRCSRLKILGLIATATLAVVGDSGFAQTPLPSNYSPGASLTLKSGRMAPPGTTIIENGAIFYNTKKFVDSSGNALTISTTNGFANRTVISRVTNLQILGDTYNPAIVFIFRDQLIRPVPGSQRDMQMGDTVLQPIALGWRNGEFNSILSYRVWLPTGRFSAGAPNNTSKGLYSQLFSASGTWIEDASLP
jgi:hypothetical protein